MEAIILAGGAGTRLRSVLSDLPKPMAPVAGRPFLSFLFDYLARYPVERAVLAVSHLRESVEQFLGSHYNGIDVSYSVEEETLGTGGAIRQATGLCTDDYLLIINGDTFFDVDLTVLLKQHTLHNADITIALKEMTDFNRYGIVDYSDGLITGFREKQPCTQGYINGGIYVIRRDLFKDLDLPSRFSFETDILQRQDNSLVLAGLPCYGNFIDIGIPKDYESAQILLPQWVRQ